MLLFNICLSCELIDVINITKFNESSINKVFITKVIESKIKIIVVIIKPLTKFFFYDFTLSTTR